jgi:hypothetical protein
MAIRVFPSAGIAYKADVEFVHMLFNKKDPKSAPAEFLRGSKNGFPGKIR